MAGRDPKRFRPQRAPEPLAKVLLQGSPDDAARVNAPIPPRAWQDVVGDRIMRRTRPLRLERKVLTVQAATAVWAQELTFLAPTIIERLSRLGFEIERLHFRVAAIDSPLRAAKPPRVKSVPAQKPLPRAVAQQIELVEDPLLRESLARAAAANLAWQAAAQHTVSEGRRDARAPRSAARETARPGQTPVNSRGATPRKP